jgi:hypothetical protein
MHYTGCVHREVKHKDPMTATKTFIAVKNYFIDNGLTAINAHRSAWQVVTGRAEKVLEVANRYNVNKLLTFC